MSSPGKSDGLRFDVGDYLKLTSGPKQMSFVEVENLDSITATEAILIAEGRRGRLDWLVVYVKGSTTALLMPPREARAHSLARCGLATCMEWLEEAGISQILVAVPSGGEEALCRNLLFLGFSRIPKKVVANQLPNWCEGYILLITNSTGM